MDDQEIKVIEKAMVAAFLNVTEQFADALFARGHVDEFFECLARSLGAITAETANCVALDKRKEFWMRLTESCNRTITLNALKANLASIPVGGTA